MSNQSREVVIVMKVKLPPQQTERSVDLALEELIHELNGEVLDIKPHITTANAVPLAPESIEESFSVLSNIIDEKNRDKLTLDEAAVQITSEALYLLRFYY